MRKLAPRLYLDFAVICGSIAIYPGVLVLMKLFLHPHDDLVVTPGPATQLRFVCVAALALSMVGCLLAYRAKYRKPAIGLLILVLTVFLVGIVVPIWGMERF